MRDNRFLGIMAIVLSNFAARTDVIFARSLMTEFPVLFVLCMGQLAALIICFFYLEIRHKLRDFISFFRKNFLYSLINAGLVGVLAPMSFLIALKFGSAINASFFVSFTPLFVTILAYFFLNEKDLTMHFFMGSFLMFLGLLTIITQGFTSGLNFSYFDFFALLASFLYAVSCVLVKKHIPLRHIDYSVMSRILCTVIFLVAVTLFVFVPAGEIDFSRIGRFAPELLGFAFITIMMTYLLFYYGLKSIPAHEATTLLLFAPLAGGLYAYFFGEEILPSHLMGGLFLIVGAIVVNVHLKSNKKLLEYKMRTRSHHS